MKRDRFPGTYVACQCLRKTSDAAVWDGDTLTKPRGAKRFPFRQARRHSLCVEAETVRGERTDLTKQFRLVRRVQVKCHMRFT